MFICRNAEGEDGHRTGVTNLFAIERHFVSYN